MNPSTFLASNQGHKTYSADNTSPIVARESSVQRETIDCSGRHIQRIGCQHVPEELPRTLGGIGIVTQGWQKCCPCNPRRYASCPTSTTKKLALTVSVQWLSFADEVIVIGDDGMIAARGNLETLSRTNDYVRGLQQTEKTLRRNREEDEMAINVIDGSPESATLKQPPADATETKAVGAETKPKRPREMNAFRYYVSSMGPGLIWGFFALVICQVGSSTAQREFASVFDRTPGALLPQLLTCVRDSSMAQVLDRCEPTQPKRRNRKVGWDLCALCGREHHIHCSGHRVSHCRTPLCGTDV